MTDTGMTNQSKIERMKLLMKLTATFALSEFVKELQYEDVKTLTAETTETKTAKALAACDTWVDETVDRAYSEWKESYAKPPIN